MPDYFIDLTSRHCKPCESGSPALGDEEIRAFLATASGWQQGNGNITKTFLFKNFYQTMAFVNALAWIAHTENHHPDMEVSYRSCLVRYSTHSISGLSENDFICAAKVNALIQSEP